MRHQAGDVVGGLGRDLVAEQCLGIGGAGEREVLPHQEPTAVALVVEVIALVHAAAPDTYEVGVRRRRLAEQAGDELAGVARRKAVGGDPVDAAHPDPLAVDVQRERCAVG